MANLFFSVILKVIQIDTSSMLSLHYKFLKSWTIEVLKTRTHSFLPRIEVCLEYLLREERLMKAPSL